jgi:hypothetical protein
MYSSAGDHNGSAGGGCKSASHRPQACAHTDVKRREIPASDHVATAGARDRNRQPMTIVSSRIVMHDISRDRQSRAHAHKASRTFIERRDVAVLTVSSGCDRGGAGLKRRARR